MHQEEFYLAFGYCGNLIERVRGVVLFTECGFIELLEVQRTDPSDLQVGIILAFHLQGCLAVLVQ